MTPVLGLYAPHYLVRSPQISALCSDFALAQPRAAASESRLYEAEVICMANDLKHVRGVVEATAQNAPDRYGFRIGQEWFGGFGSCPVEKGDEVEVVYADNGRFHNVKDVLRPGELAEEEAPESNSDNGAEESADQSSKNSRIARAVALKCAAALCSFSSDAAADDVIEMAEKFEGWLRATSR